MAQRWMNNLEMDSSIDVGEGIQCPIPVVGIQARKAAINKVPEQVILSEVRRMVEEMQALNKKLEETSDYCMTRRKFHAGGSHCRVFQASRQGS
ncbi:hypothetical protein Fmac_028217 [Flemingia macrophylla]|uniref:Uncharacterized protein n=1 Tax=Flemingia macrophylla TaxID=520843 RepID=A0ABD1L7B3_9FABA